MHKAASTVGLTGHCFNRNCPSKRATTSNDIPPTARRIAPIAIGCAPSGANACAVPVVPQSIAAKRTKNGRSEEHTSELQSRGHLVCRLLLEKKKENDGHQRDEDE